MKCAYYVGQNGARVFPPDYMERVFVPWREHPEEVEREFGTHPYGGGGSAPFDGEHPPPVTRRLLTTEITEDTERGMAGRSTSSVVKGR